jgi:predicted NBD/HSP70 family sugar kinase
MSGASGGVESAKVSTAAAVLDAIRERVTVSRVELAEATGLTAATITHAIRRLIELGFVHEVGTARSVSGTPRRLLEVEPTACFTVGVQFDRFSMTGVLVDLAGNVLTRGDRPGAHERPPGEALAELACFVDSLIHDARVPRSKVRGVGVATYGPQDRDSGALLTPQPTAEWFEYPLTETLSRSLGIPVLIENDATAAGVGEEGLGGSRASFATVYMSGGIGSGVVLDGQPYRGATSNGVELGHISLDATGAACACGNVGCVENLAGPTAVVERARRDPALSSRVDLTTDTLTAFQRIGSAAMNGDGPARALILDSATALAAATVSLVNLFDVARVVFAGNAFAEVGGLYRKAAQRALDRSAFMRFAHPVSVELSANVSDAAAIGGAVMVLRSLLQAQSRTRGARLPAA